MLEQVARTAASKQHIVVLRVPIDNKMCVRCQDHLVELAVQSVKKVLPLRGLIACLKPTEWSSLNPGAKNLCHRGARLKIHFTFGESLGEENSTVGFV